MSILLIKDSQVYQSTAGNPTRNGLAIFCTPKEHSPTNQTSDCSILDRQSMPAIAVESEKRVAIQVRVEPPYFVIVND